MNFKQINDTFFKLENSLNLFDKKIQWVFFWELIRFSINREILVKSWTIKSAFKVDFSLKNICNTIIFVFRNLLLNNILFSKKKCTYIFSHSRRHNIDWKYYDIYSDFLKEKLISSKIEYQDFEWFKQDFLSPKSDVSKNIKSYMPIDIIIQYFSFGIKLSNSEQKLLEDIQSKIQHDIGVDINIKQIVSKNISKFKLYSKFWEWLFKKKKPTLIYEVVWYWIWMFALNSVASKLKIKTIELQHGVIDKYHLWYSTGSHKRNLQYAPDELYLWWDYWGNACNFSQDTKKTSYWFEFFNNNYSKYIQDTKNKSNNILVISQTTIWEDLAKEILELSKLLPNHIFYYKLHPLEFIKLDKELSFLKWVKNIKVICAEKNLYELFWTCNTQIWIYSTWLYEWLWFGLKTIVFDLPWVEYLDDLVQKDIVIKVKDAKEYVSSIKILSKKSIDRNLFFKEN